MKIFIENLPEKLFVGAEIICEKHGVSYEKGGEELKVQLSLTDEIAVCGNTIFYKKETDIFRLLVKWIEAKKKGDNLSLTETRQFDTFGVMLDFSRNEIMNLRGIKEYITYAAGFGVDRIMLYLEDTYEVKDYPYMGYFRGRYSAEELKEINDYAANFGIETIACIQTLGHMEHFLRWHNELKDTASVLLCDEEKTYEFIEKCLNVIADNISSPYIHIGMDEAFNLGGGAYKARFGEVDAGELFVKHLNRVCKMCEKIGKKPVIWGDMLVALSSDKGYCADEHVEIRKDLIEKLPDVDIVYWDYYSIKESHYENMLDMFIDCGKKVWFAGGIWTWETMTYGDMRTKQTTQAALDACKNKKIKDVFATTWVNPGGYCPLIAGLYGLAVWSEQVFESETGNVDEEFEIVTGAKGESFSLLTNLDAPTIMPQQNLAMPDQQPSSGITSFLFQSIMCGLFDNVTKDYDLTSYYKALATKISEMKSEKFSEMFDYYEALAKALSLKANLGNYLYKAYQENDKVTLRKIAEETIPELMKYMKEVIRTHRILWNRYNKPFGFDAIRNHFAGVIADCFDTKETINEYLDGKTEKIEQLCEKRLDYMHPFSQNETGFLTDVSYSSVYSVSKG